MKKAATAHLRRSQMLLELAISRIADSQVRWRSRELGPGKDVHPRWYVMGGKIRFHFRDQDRNRAFWVSAVKPRSWGVEISLIHPSSPIREKFEILWQDIIQESTPEEAGLWHMVHGWIKQKFPSCQIVHTSWRSDLSHSLSGVFLRVLLFYRGKDYLVVATDSAASGEAHLALSQALLWLSYLARKKQFRGVSTICFLVPSGHSAVLYHRCRYLNKQRTKAEVWEYDGKIGPAENIRRAPPPPPALENRDFRWPVLGPFRWSSQLEQVLNLAPDSIRRYPRFQDYDSLRLWGLEFAQVMGAERDRIFFGVGSPRIELQDHDFDRLRLLVHEILFYRRPDSPDTQHPYYRLQAERWLEARVLEDISRLFPEMAAESVYSQIPVYLGREPARVDILGVDRQGTLVVMELKVSADPDLPLQALDYWGRVIRHNRNGDFKYRGYFSEIRLNRARPKIYLVSPVFSFHDSTERLLGFLDPNLEVWKIAINQDWRCGVKILGRTRFRCEDLE